MAKRGDIIFEVDWHPKDKCETVEDADYNVEIERFADFDSAAKRACEVAENDFFGVSKITRKTLENVKYDWWEADFHWHAESPCVATDLDANSPSYVDYY